MKLAAPPKLASWLLYHQVGGYRAESLVGDLTEEYAQGRGDGWYWGQVLLAVARSYRRALRMYGLHLLLAVAAGWCALLVGVALLERIWGFAVHALGSFSADWPALNAAYGVAWTILAGSIDFFVGRLVVRIYRPHPRLIALVFALSILMYMLPSLYGLAIEALADSRRIPALAQELAATLLWMVSAWLGAQWQIRIDIKSAKR